MSRGEGARVSGTPRLQPLVRARLATLGAEGAAWTAALPDVLAELAGKWGLELGRGLPGGSASYVARARTASGDPRVVKVALPGEGAALAGEAAVLRAAEGRGYVRLHAYDGPRGALLLEALGRSLEQSMLPPERTLDALVDVLAIAWRTPSDLPRPTTGRAVELARLVRESDARHPGVCDPAVLDRALTLADHLAATDDPAAWVLCHGDPHPANALRRPDGEGWALVDPDGVWADPAYDLGVVVREWTHRVERSDDPRALIRSYADRLAARAGLHAERVEAWGFLERVSTGLYVHDLGAEAMGRRFLDSARRLVV